jgi:hypothetical protein
VAVHSGTDWVAFGGVAQLIAAGATVLLAAFTARMARRTHDVATETKKESAATISLANEAKTDRELAWRPQLALRICDVIVRNGVPGEFSFQIVNAGGAPGIGCMVLARLPQDISHWGMWAVGDIGSGSTDLGISRARGDGTPCDLFAEPSSMEIPRRTADAVISVVMCWVGALGFL